MKRMDFLACLFGLACCAYGCQARAAEQPALTMAAPSWAFEPMPIADSNEPEWIGAAFADFAEDERVESIMASVTPFEGDDAAEPFASLAVHAQPVLIESHPEMW